MTLATIILSVIAGLPPYYPETLPGPFYESPADRVERLRPWAEEIAARSRNMVEAAALVELGRQESNWARYVMERGCPNPPPKSARCDKGTSYGPFQQKRGTCPAAWAAEPGSHEELSASIECGLRLLRGGVHVCKSMAGAYSYYAGRGCDQQWGLKREHGFRVVLQRLHAERARQR